MHHSSIKILVHLLVLTSFRTSTNSDGEWMDMGLSQECCHGDIQKILMRALEFASMERKLQPQVGEKHSGAGDFNPHLDRFNAPGESSALERQYTEGRSNQIMPKYLKRQSATGQDSLRWKRGEVSVRKLAELLHTLKTIEPNDSGLPPLQSLRFG